LSGVVLIIVAPPEFIVEPLSITFEVPPFELMIVAVAILVVI
jgi:hypothetical protein